MRRTLWMLLALALVATACGDDTDTASTSPAATAGTTTQPSSATTVTTTQPPATTTTTAATTTTAVPETTTTLPPLDVVAVNPLPSRLVDVTSGATVAMPDVTASVVTGSPVKMIFSSVHGFAASGVGCLGVTFFSPDFAQVLFEAYMAVVSGGCTAMRPPVEIESSDALVFTDRVVAFEIGEMTDTETVPIWQPTASDGTSLGLAVPAEPFSFTDVVSVAGATHLVIPNGDLIGLGDDWTVIEQPDVAEGGSCVPGDTTLCLNDGRFRVSLDWADSAQAPRGGLGGTADPVPLDGPVVTALDDTGTFWFFDEGAVDAMVTVINGCALNDRLWVFAASATGVEWTLSVEDTGTGDTRTYGNPLGIRSPAITDTDAFATCP